MNVIYGKNQTLKISIRIHFLKERIFSTGEF
jgi:hypothetical protein